VCVCFWQGLRWDRRVGSTRACSLHLLLWASLSKVRFLSLTVLFAPRCPMALDTRAAACKDCRLASPPSSHRFHALGGGIGRTLWTALQPVARQQEDRHYPGTKQVGSETSSLERSGPALSSHPSANFLLRHDRQLNWEIGTRSSPSASRYADCIVVPWRKGSFGCLADRSGRGKEEGASL
jgi:hypothetical protein